MKKTRKGFNLLILALLTAVLYMLVFGITGTYAWLEAESGSSRDGQYLIEIRLPDVAPDPDSSNFNDLVESLIAADPFLKNMTSTIHILGVNNGKNAPTVEATVELYDVVIWQRENGTVVAAQVIGAISQSIFSTWVSVEAALITSDEPINGTGTNYNAGYVYTRQNAPVNYGGYRWLARHDNVTSVPSVGDDWFRVGANWIEQYYVVGSFVLYNGKHYRKVHDFDAPPALPSVPTDGDEWEEVPVYEHTTEYEVWYQRTWNLNDIVIHDGLYYASSTANNVTVPGAAGSSWRAFIEYDAGATVPVFTAGTTYAIGDLVRVGSDYYRCNVTYTQPNPVGDTSGAWTPVYDWNELVGVSKWSADITYGNGSVGLLVEYGSDAEPEKKQIYEKLAGWANPGVPPPEQGQVWRRILRWSETQKPVEFTTGDYPANRIFKVTASGGAETYYASVQTTYSWIPNDPANGSALPYYRPVSEWSAAQEYTVLGNDVWTTSRWYHCYTVDGEGNITFWYLGTLPSGTTVTGANPAGGAAGAGNPNNYTQDPASSPYWKKIEFICAEQTVVTVINGRFVVWDRSPSAANPIREPSAMNADWIRRSTGVTDEYVYIMNDGALSLWRRIGAAGTEEEPSGLSGDWQRIDYRTGKNYVFTVRSGIMSFWYTPTQSATAPGSAGWVSLTPSAGTVPEYIYVSGAYHYTGHSENPSDWKDLSQAWTGSLSSMVYHWDIHTVYSAGDWAVFGITGTNLYRYFVFTGFDPIHAVGVSPMSSDGALYWTPIR